jgi:hypothetical protein
LIAVFALAMPGLLTPQLVRASGDGMGCNPGRSTGGGDWHDGGDDVISYTPGGVASYIYEYSPYVQPGSDLVVAYVMLWNHYYPDYYSQIGWYEAPGSVRKTFTEQGLGENGEYDRRLYAPLPIAGEYQYEVTYNPNNANTAFNWYANGTNYGSYPNTFGPDQAEISTERHNNNSQTPGGVDENEYFTESRILNFSTGTWANYSFNDPYYNSGEDKQAITGYNLWTWDLKCTH